MAQNYTLDDLRVAIENGSENDKIVEFLKDKNTWEYIYPHGETLLHWAAAFDNEFIIDFLLRHIPEEVGIPILVDLSNFRGTTALYYAAMKNSRRAITRLLEFKANPRIRSGFSNSFPIDVVDDKEELMEADNRIPIDYMKGLKPKEYSVYGLRLCYLYRVYMCYLTNLEYFMRMKWQGHSHNYEATVIPDVQEIFDAGGINAVIQAVSRKHKEYLEFTEVDKSQTRNSCLHCNKDSKFRCGKCKCAYYCSVDCQKAAHMFHRYDCETK